MNEFVTEVTDTNWETEVLKSSQPVLVDFWAPWCGPCRVIGPYVDAVAEKFQGQAKVVKMNVDENMTIPSSYGIKGIPTLLVFNGGQLVDSHVGQLPMHGIAQLIERQLPKPTEK